MELQCDKRDIEPRVVGIVKNSHWHILIQSHCVIARRSTMQVVFVIQKFIGDNPRVALSDPTLTRHCTPCEMLFQPNRA